MAKIERTNPPAVCDISSFYSSISNNSTVEGNSVKIESLFIEEDDVGTRFDSENLVVDSGEVTGVTPEFLSKIWSITEDQAATAIEQNTQLNRQSSKGMLSKQFSTNDRMLRYKRIKSSFLLTQCL